MGAVTGYRGCSAALARPVAHALPEAAHQGFVDLLDMVYASGEPYVATATPFAV